MNKAIYALSATMFGITAGLTSCIQDEAPNAECDLLKVIVHTKQPETVFYSLNDTIKEVSTSESKVVFKVRETADLSSLNFEFELTEGATIDTMSEMVGEEKLLIATTKSEDKKWNKQYSIRFKAFSSSFTGEKFEDFQIFAEKGVYKYYTWMQGSDPDFWATGNPGYKLSRSTAKPDDYPTVVIDGYEGKGVALITRSTGSFGNMVGMPIAAGNLFIGSFDVSNALQDAMAATVFGVPFQIKPYRIKFMAKYKAGSVYKDKKGNVIDKKDRPDMYAVLYKNTDSNGKAVLLHGDDGKTNPNIVAHAFMSDADVAKLTEEEWREISIPFKYTSQVSDDMLADFGYNLAIVFSSSIEGGEFAGAVGSTFSIDEVKLVFDENEK